MSGHKRHNGIRLRSLFLWHRYLGLCAALFVVVLAVSGGLLNHADTLRLDERHVDNTALLSGYRIKPPEAITSYRVGSHWVSQMGAGLYLDEALLVEGERLIGAVALERQWVIASDNQLLLLTLEGDLIERLTPLTGLPPEIDAIGIDDGGGLLLRTATGIYHPDESYSEWQRLEGAAAHWSTPEPVPPSLRQTLVQSYRGAALSWERVILDLHTGRILGSGGVYLMDTAALFMVGLALTGLWHWAQRKRK